MNIFYSSISKFNSFLYLSWAFQLNVSCSGAGILLLVFMPGVVSAALYLLLGSPPSDIA